METRDTQTIRLERDRGLARIVLARPEVRNAFNDRMIQELLAALQAAEEDPQVRVILLSGEGKVFCAGADLSWMRQVIDRSFEENLQESLRLAELFERLGTLPKPVIARVHGAAIGGGNGLVAACDIAVTAETAKFSLSEAKLGLIPAAIGPYIIRRIGEGRARALFLTGERFDGRQAEQLGLVYRAVPEDRLDQEVQRLLAHLFTSGPQAMAAAKRLLREVRGLDGEALNRVTARSIGQLRVSPEGQEGMRAFLEKRRPTWSMSWGDEG